MDSYNGNAVNDSTTVSFASGFDELKKRVEQLIEENGRNWTEEYLDSILDSVSQGEAYENLMSEYFYIMFGGKKWRILEKNGDLALVIVEDILLQRPYNNESVPITWEKCALRAWLNGEFLNGFSGQERSAIMETRIANKDNQTIPGGNDTRDRVFLLSLEEANKYFEDNEDRIAKGTQHGWWWLRSPGNGDSDRAARVGSDGCVFGYGRDVFNEYGGVRPALWLNLKSLISKS